MVQIWSLAPEFPHAVGVPAYPPATPTKKRDCSVEKHSRASVMSPPKLEVVLYVLGFAPGAASYFCSLSLSWIVPSWQL